MKKRDEVDEQKGRELFCWVCGILSIAVAVIDWANGSITNFINTL